MSHVTLFSLVLYCIPVRLKGLFPHMQYECVNDNYNTYTLYGVFYLNMSVLLNTDVLVVGKIL